MWRLAGICVRVTLIFLAAQVAVLTGSRLVYPGEYSDPFAPYEAMMPGRGITYEDAPCDFETMRGYDETTSCVTHPMNGAFDSVTSSVYNGSFAQIIFSANHVLVGDIIRHWGRPDIVVKFNHRTFYLLWYDQGLIGIIDPVGPVGQFNYMLPVENFTSGLQPHNAP